MRTRSSAAVGAPLRSTVSSPQDGDHVVEKMRMNGFYNTRLDILLRGLGAETLIITGAWTNMSIEHTARHAADAGYRPVVASDVYLNGRRRVAERSALLRDAERRLRGHVRRDRKRVRWMMQTRPAKLRMLPRAPDLPGKIGGA